MLHHQNVQEERRCTSLENLGPQVGLPRNLLEKAPASVKFIEISVRMNPVQAKLALQTMPDKDWMTW
jgi:hypothetical protein